MDGKMRWLFPGMCGFVMGFVMPGKAIGCIVAIVVYAFTWQVNEDCLKMIEEDEKAWQ